MYSKKMVLIPSDAVGQTGYGEDVNMTSNATSNEPLNRKPKRIERDTDKITKLLYIVLKIASNNSYDEDLKILDRNNQPISDSNIVVLLNHCLSHEKILVGEKDFIRILYESKVDPNWIVNENVRAKLLNFKNTPPRPPPPPHFAGVRRKMHQERQEDEQQEILKQMDLAPSDRKTKPPEPSDSILRPPWEVPVPSDDEDV